MVAKHIPITNSPIKHTFKAIPEDSAVACTAGKV